MRVGHARPKSRASGLLISTTEEAFRNRSISRSEGARVNSFRYVCRYVDKDVPHRLVCKQNKLNHLQRVGILLQEYSLGGKFVGKERTDSLRNKGKKFSKRKTSDSSLSNLWKITCSKEDHKEKHARINNTKQFFLIQTTGPPCGLQSSSSVETSNKTDGHFDGDGEVMISYLGQKPRCY